MQIDEIIWQQQFVEKLAVKHGVEKAEVEEVLSNRPRFRFISKGNRAGEDVYSAMGQTDAGTLPHRFFYPKIKSSGIDYQCKRHGQSGAKELWQTKIENEIQCRLRTQHQRRSGNFGIQGR